MSNTKDIKRRIKSISSTLQVTKALELVSSVKMRRAVAIAAESREFSSEIWELILQLYPKNEDAKLPKLFTKPDAKKSLAIVLASDKGLAGSYNANVMRKTKEVLGKLGEVDIVAVGKRAAKVDKILTNVNIISAYDSSDEDYDFFEAGPIIKMVTEKYTSGEYNSVIMIYTDFINTLKQVATSKVILPISIRHAEPDSASHQENEDRSQIKLDPKGPLRGDDSQDRDDKLTDSTGHRPPATDYKYEPDIISILETLGKLAVNSQIYQALLDASASEHAARMVAMKNATENGNQLVQELKFAYNQLRQGAITQEIAEISAGRIALGN